MSVWVCNGYPKHQTEQQVRTCPIRLENGCNSTLHLGKPCDAKEYAEVKRGTWRRMGSYCRATQDSPIAISKAVTGFQCTACGNKWFTQEFSVEGKEQTPAYCERCGALMGKQG